MVEKLNEQEEAMMKEQGLGEADIVAENEKRAKEESGTPPEGKKEGEENVEPPAETAEEAVSRLTTELTETKAADAGKVKDLVSMRDEARALRSDLETLRAANVQPQPEGTKFPEVADEDDVSGADLKQVKESFATLLKAERDRSDNLAISLHRQTNETLTRMQHPEDFDKHYAVFQEAVKDDELLGRIANLEQNPVEFMYQWGKAHGNGDPATVKAEGAAEVVEKLNQAKVKFAGSGGGGEAPTKVTVEQAAAMTPTQWGALPEADRARIMRESGS